MATLHEKSTQIMFVSSPANVLKKGVLYTRCFEVRYPYGLAAAEEEIVIDRGGGTAGYRTGGARRLGLVPFSSCRKKIDRLELVKSGHVVSDLSEDIILLIFSIRERQVVAGRLLQVENKLQTPSWDRQM